MKCRDTPTKTCMKKALKTCVQKTEVKSFNVNWILMSPKVMYGFNVIPIKLLHAILFPGRNR